MAKFDLEMLVEDIRSTMLAKFNAKVQEINAEKNDGKLLKELNPEAYVIQSFNGKMANWNPVCLIAEEGVTTTAKGPYSSHVHAITVAIIEEDTGEDIEIAARIYRYRRCLEEIFTKNWTGGRGGIKLEVTSLVPISLQDTNSSNRYRAVGVQLEGSLT